MLSHFGALFETSAKRRGLSKRDLAKIAGISSGKLSESLRDQEWAKKGKKRWYAPDLSLIHVWVRVFHLSDDERAEFEEAALLEHCPPEARRLVASLRSNLSGLRKELEAFGVKAPKRGNEGKRP